MALLRYCPRCRARCTVRTFLEGDTLVGRCSRCGLVLATSPDKPSKNTTPAQDHFPELDDA